jgi:hypothetical protein
MAREIPLDKIGDYYQEGVRKLVVAATLAAEERLKKHTPVFSLANYTKAELDSMPDFFTVRGKVVPLKKALEERPTGGTLRGAWTISYSNSGFVGDITNRMEYAEPVVYGTNLPPSWNNQYRTRQNTIPGFPDLVAKELEPWAQREYQKIIRRG